MKLKKGDLVQVIRGKDKGKTEKIETVYEKEGKVLVTGVNMYKRHVKGRMQGQTSEIKDIIKPLPATNVALVCPKCSKLTRVGYIVSKEGNKERICKKCKKSI